ncbi:hypothetical protein [Agaribacter marinus]|uniref:Uncharacterized protein n=1 Tax=Agaribacter marinus TaxID=1431249 RepID=A0AA37WJU2_9ALTE|nr:hypothetical protein [Agaribacter marinus]GLR72572.1 hypothetical protein GCM10007852_34800 [Agaribacter marinus]
MSQDIRDLTAYEMNFVFGGEIADTTVTEEEQRPKDNDSGAGRSSGANLLAGVGFVLLGAATAAVIPFLAAGAVVGAGLAASAAVLTAGGGVIISLSS